jgi:hypothetical protein
MGPWAATSGATVVAEHCEQDFVLGRLHKDIAVAALDVANREGSTDAELAQVRWHAGMPGGRDMPKGGRSSHRRLLAAPEGTDRRHPCHASRDGHRVRHAHCRGYHGRSCGECAALGAAAAGSRLGTGLAEPSPQSRKMAASTQQFLLNLARARRMLQE